MRKLFTLAFALTILTQACVNQSNKETSLVVTTTGILGDAVQSLLSGIDSIEIESLMGPGVDPHLYKATQGDIQALSRADLIIYNGLHLEGKMNEIFERLPAEKRYAAAEVIPSENLVNATEYADAYDPHLWFDLELWSQVIEGLGERLSAEFPEHQALITTNQRQLVSKTLALHDSIKESLAQIPDSARVLITAHDAFKYFGRAYAVEVRGLQGISTTAEYGIRDIKDLSDFIVRRKLKAVFIESSVSPRAIEALQEACAAKGWTVKLGGQLYSDALGGAKSGADHYLPMVRKNVSTIKTALQ